MDDQARGFIHHDKMLIFIDDSNGDVFWGDVPVFMLEDNHLYFRPGAQTQTGSTGLSIDIDETTSDELLQLRSGEMRDC
jgi:hypothetical protein